MVHPATEHAAAAAATLPLHIWPRQQMFVVFDAVVVVLTAFLPEFSNGALMDLGCYGLQSLWATPVAKSAQALCQSPLYCNASPANSL